MDIVATIIGYVLFALSEVLPFVNVPTNGFLHTFLLGFKNAFSNPSRDIEMAALVTKDPNLASMINTISTNPHIKSLIDSIIKDPALANVIHSAQGNTIMTSQLNILISNPQLQNILNAVTQNPEFCNNVSVMVSNPSLINSILSTMQNKQLFTLLENPTTLSILSQNNTLMTLIPYINTSITNNIQEILKNPQLSGTLSAIETLSVIDKKQILSILTGLSNNPDPTLIANISGLVSQAQPEPQLQPTNFPIQYHKSGLVSQAQPTNFPKSDNNVQPSPQELASVRVS